MRFKVHFSFFLFTLALFSLSGVNVALVASQWQHRA